MHACFHAPAWLLGYRGKEKERGRSARPPLSRLPLLPLPISLSFPLLPPRRCIFLETVAGVPGMVGGTLRHLRSLRLMKRDQGEGCFQ
jgi:hypothetical protein